MAENINGWAEWSRFVLKELERLGESCESLRKDIQMLRDDVIMLKTKTAMWGAIAGTIAGLIGSGIVSLLK